MVLAALVKGYTTKSLGQLRQEGGRLHHEEGRTRQELVQAEVLQESGDALRNQVEFDCKKLADEITSLVHDLQNVAADMGRSEIDDEEQ